MNIGGSIPPEATNKLKSFSNLTMKPQVKTKYNKVKLTELQAQKIVQESPFGDDRDESTIVLLTSEINTKFYLKRNEGFFTVSWSNRKIIWRDKEDNPFVRALILEFFKARNFEAFQRNARKFLNGKKWSWFFKKVLSLESLELQKKGKVYLQKNEDGKYSVTLDKRKLGLVPQIVAVHIWNHPEFYYALHPISSKELVSLHASRTE